MCTDLIHESRHSTFGIQSLEPFFQIMPEPQITAYRPLDLRSRRIAHSLGVTKFSLSWIFWPFRRIQCPLTGCGITSLLIWRFNQLITPSLMFNPGEAIEVSCNYLEASGDQSTPLNVPFDSFLFVLDSSAPGPLEIYWFKVKGGVRKGVWTCRSGCRWFMNWRPTSYRTEDESETRQV